MILPILLVVLAILLIGGPGALLFVGARADRASDDGCRSPPMTSTLWDGAFVPGLGGTTDATTEATAGGGGDDDRPRVLTIRRSRADQVFRGVLRAPGSRSWSSPA